MGETPGSPTVSMKLQNMAAQAQRYPAMVFNNGFHLLDRDFLQEASRRSENAFEFKEGTLYPALHQLEKKGHLKAEWRTSENGRGRKYYSLTSKGKKAAREYEKQWQHLTGAISAVLESD